MNDLSRRSLLRGGAGTAVAVPMALLGSKMAAAAEAAEDAGVIDPVSISTDQPVLFCVHDASTGEVSILHGGSEVIVRDRKLVARILRAAKSTSTANVVAATQTTI